MAHGVGTELAEPPFAGADFAPEAEAAMVLVEGNVLMIEPYIWEVGVGGYRAEYCAVVGATGTEIVELPSLRPVARPLGRSARRARQPAPAAANPARYPTVMPWASGPPGPP